MSKDHTERRLYRKSPGRQYGYEHDPLQSRTDPQKHVQTGRLSNTEEIADRSSGQLRPDLRRTRQLLRKNILASKQLASKEVDEQEGQEVSQGAPGHAEHDEFVEHERPTRNARPSQAPSRSVRPSRRELVEEDYDEELDAEDWQEDFGDVDPDLGYEEEAEEAHYPAPRSRYVDEPTVRPRPAAPIRRRSTALSKRLVDPEVLDDRYYEDDEEDEAPVRKRKVSRRGLITGVGIVALGGAGVAAYELVPKIPQAVSNVEHQIQDAFNRGVAQGADAARKAFLTELDNLEGFSLQGAVAAAKLTRVSYDVFVSPIVKFGSSLAGGFLTVMLNGFKSARRILAYINQDNETLGAIQKVLETWVQDVNNLPKQLDAITDTDLDGAQAYLNALQQKIQTEKAKLNGAGATPTPKPGGTPTPTH